RPPIGKSPIVFSESPVKSRVQLHNSDFCHKPTVHYATRFKNGNPSVGHWWLWSVPSPLINVGGSPTLCGSTSAFSSM
ncbi:hypothetical protein HAX54_016584, partial [Datura stramonium]|nr:hypothetical protein [Datura stramonium]